MVMIGMLMNILMQYFRVLRIMGELRRLLIPFQRIKQSQNNDKLIALTKEEDHYLARVLRFKTGDRLHVVDGLGNLWLADFEQNCSIKLATDYKHPSQSETTRNPLTCLAVVIPKRGFDEIIRMSTEIGIDIRARLNIWSARRVA